MHDISSFLLFIYQLLLYFIGKQIQKIVHLCLIFSITFQNEKLQSVLSFFYVSFLGFLLLNCRNLINPGSMIRLLLLHVVQCSKVVGCVCCHIGPNHYAVLWSEIIEQICSDWKSGSEEFEEIYFKGLIRKWSEVRIFLLS